jgi:hypothetical protein
MTTMPRYPTVQTVDNGCLDIRTKKRFTSSSTHKESVPNHCKNIGLKVFFCNSEQLFACLVFTASKTEDSGFESRQGVGFLGLYTLQCCCQNLVCSVIACI